MKRHHVLTLIAVATLGLAVTTTAPVQTAAKTTPKTTKVTEYKIGKKSYTLKQMRQKYNLHYRATRYKKLRSTYNVFDGRTNEAMYGTFNMFTGKNRVKTLTSKTKKYYSFSSVYFTPKGKDGYWNYDSHAIDSKTGHVYHFISIGSAGGK